MNKEEFINACKDLGINLTKEKMELLIKFKDLVLEWNEKFNLTSILDEKDFYLKHYYDSLCLIKVVDLNVKNTLCDIGTGAGFPGIVLKIIFPSLKIVLIESNGKKCEFLKLVVKDLELSDIEVINERAEEYARKNRERFDIVTSRAVSHLKILTEISLPLLKTEGLFLPLKGNMEEIIESKSFIKEIGGYLKDIITYRLPIENSERSIPLIIKKNKTDMKYPRNYNQIIKFHKLINSKNT